MGLGGVGRKGKYDQNSFSEILKELVKHLKKKKTKNKARAGAPLAKYVLSRCEGLDSTSHTAESGCAVDPGSWEAKTRGSGVLRLSSNPFKFYARL